MIIDCISDLHGYLPKLEGGDLLIVAGDWTARDNEIGYIHFLSWFVVQPYRKRILVSGNHDGFIQKHKNWQVGVTKAFDYLEDSSTEFEGLKIYGSPWTPEFCNWHFMKKRGAELKAVWDKIPDDTDILITHGPPHGILDQVKRFNYPHTKTRLGNFINNQYENTGCEELRLALERLKPKLHVFGHIHENGGQQLVFKRPGYGDENNTICVNACIMNEDYEPVHKPVRIILEGKPVSREEGSEKDSRKESAVHSA